MQRAYSRQVRSQKAEVTLSSEGERQTQCQSDSTEIQCPGSVRYRTGDSLEVVRQAASVQPRTVAGTSFLERDGFQAYPSRG